ncbi:MAG TPA: MFS transporter [Cytophagales bacterium]|nr:MFS transporter [Cytophagales bacterium]
MKATKLDIFSLGSVPMRTFHVTWLTFFLCFFGWFGIAPLMPQVKKAFSLTPDQITNIMIASVSVTIFARLAIGYLCEKYGPRLTYTIMLLIGALPVIGIGYSDSYESFLLFRLAIGVIGASFVVTQYHTSVMFAPNVVGRANATAAGWGNLGAFGSHALMPLLAGLMVTWGFTDEQNAWRAAMVIPGVALLIMAFVYYRFTQDTPEGNVIDLRKNNPEYRAKNPDVKGSFWIACRDYRTWVLFLVYGACFGIEVMMDNKLTMYFSTEYAAYFKAKDFTEAQVLKYVGFIVASFALMNIFARALGGIFADKIAEKYGTKGKVVMLGVFLFFEGLGVMLFSQTQELAAAIAVMIGFALFIKMSNGVTYSIVPFVNKNALGSISGIVGAGGNLGALLATLTFKYSGGDRNGFFYIGVAIVIISFTTYFMKFNAPSTADTINISKKEEALAS